MKIEDARRSAVSDGFHIIRVRREASESPRRRRLGDELVYERDGAEKRVVRPVGDEKDRVIGSRAFE
jgi:hypothetical protein